jgi:hypothetical protein
VEDGLNSLSERQALILDTTRVLFLDYYFCDMAFGRLFEAAFEERWPLRYVLFRLSREADRRKLFHGILRYLKRAPLPKNAEMEAGFASMGLHANLIDPRTKAIQHFGQLGEDQQRVWDVVNEAGRGTARQIAEALDIIDEEAVDALRSLASVRLVVEVDESSSSGHVYYSCGGFLEGSR